MKRDSKGLKDSFLSHLLDAVQQAVIATDPEGKILYWNKFAQELYGWTAAEMVGGSIIALTPGPSVEQATETMERLGRGESWSGEYPVRRKDGTEFLSYVTNSPICNEEKELIGIIGVSIDVTGQRRMERTLEERKREVNCLFLVSELLEEPGVSLEEILQGVAELLRGAFQYPGITDVRVCLGEMEYRNRDFESSPWYMVSDINVDHRKTGDITIFYREEKPREWEGPFLEEERELLDAVCERLGRAVEQYRAKEESFSIERQYRLLFEESNDAVFIHESTGEKRILNVNKKACQMLGYSREQLLTMCIPDLHPPDQRQPSRGALKQVGEDGQVRFETRFRKADGTHIDVGISSRVIEPQRGLVQGIARDISQWKQQESERELTIEILRLITTTNSIRELIRLTTHLLQEWSGCEAVGIRLREGEDFPYYETLGFPQEFVEAERHLCARDQEEELLRDSTGNAVLECMCGNVICGRFDPSLPFFTENGSFWSNDTTRLLATTSEADRQSRTRNRCNGEGYESVALVPLRTAHETFGLLQVNDFRKNRFNPRRIALFESLGNSLAIALSERRTVQKLIDGEKQYRDLFDNMLDGFALHEIILGETGKPVDYRFLSINPAFERMTGLKARDITGKTVLEVLPGTEAYWIDTYGKVALEGEPIRFENFARELEKHFEVYAFRSADMQFATVFHEITETKEAEEKLKTSLKEKELLLMEVHHRVKNNLQVISSLLSLQGFQMDDPKIRLVLEESRRRIQSIARVHENMYRTGDFSCIDFKTYIDGFVEELSHVFGIGDRVTLEVRVDDAVIGIDKAVPCGLILSELVTNAMKHAFPGERGGKIFIRFHKLPDEEAVLFEVSDDGAGLPENIQVGQQQYVGLYLVDILARQLGGTLEVDRGKGTAFRVRFPGEKLEGSR